MSSSMRKRRRLVPLLIILFLAGEWWVRDALGEPAALVFYALVFTAFPLLRGGGARPADLRWEAALAALGYAMLFWIARGVDGAPYLVLGWSTALGVALWTVVATRAMRRQPATGRA